MPQDSPRTCRSHDRLENGNQPSNVVQPLLTDSYQVSMAYAFWKNNKSDDRAVFDLFFRRNPFTGEFTIFAGLEECLKFLENFFFSESDINYLRELLPNCEPEFFDYLQNINADDLELYAVDEGMVVFPKSPLIRVEGPIIILQLLETTLLNLVNFASLVTTNAARFRNAAGRNKQLIEFGLRRAQGPDGALSASKYCYMGGFDATSNVLAGKLFGVPVSGTHAHSFVSSFTSIAELKLRTLKPKDGGEEKDFVSRCEHYKEKVCNILQVVHSESSEGELAAFIAYGLAFPDKFLSLVDTYNVLQSGVPNCLAVCLALDEFGYKPKGIRLDSGDLAYLSVMCRISFVKVAEVFNRPQLKDLIIVASNDINEDTIISLNAQKVLVPSSTDILVINADNKTHGHSIDAFGIGTHLVTCQKQPALGCVYKIVQVNGIPRMKLSEEISKITIPSKKKAFRLFGKDDQAILDLLIMDGEVEPKPGQRILARHPFEEAKRVYVTPARVEPLHKCYWKKGKICQPLPTLREIKEKVQASVETLRPDHKRHLNPTPYKVSLSEKLYHFMHSLWLDNSPITELC